MKTNCNIIKDLLPLYAEDMLSEESAALVKEHLGECPECSYELIGMKDDSRKKRVEKDVKETIYRKNELKKLNRKMNRRISINILIIIVLSLTTIISSVYAVNSTRLLYEELSSYENKTEYPDDETMNDTMLAEKIILKQFGSSNRRKLYSIVYKGEETSSNILKKINSKLNDEEQFIDCAVFTLTFRGSYDGLNFLKDILYFPYYKTLSENWVAVKDKEGEWSAYMRIDQYDNEFLINEYIKIERR